MATVSKIVIQRTDESILVAEECDQGKTKSSADTVLFKTHLAKEI
jgi:hypothetical protein